MPLSLHQLTALDASPRELIDIARRLRIDSVCLFTHVPEAALGRFPLVGHGEIGELQVALEGAGVTLANLEVFPLDRNGPREEFESGLAVGAALGATRATAHLHDISNEQEAIDRFGDFAERAARHGIVAGLEFNIFSAVRDIGSGERIVRAAGRGSLVLDMLHTVRGGATAADVAQAADLVGYAQLCDGPAVMPTDRRWHEAVSERLVPGEGEFPLIDLARPLGLDVLFDVEVPQTSARKAGTPPFERARRAVIASRVLLDRLDEERTP
jgi:sugar phosphate isomerase/epimerase